MLDHGADVNNENRVGGNTALLYASWYGHLNVVQLLLDHDDKERVDVNHEDKYGNTALSRNE